MKESEAPDYRILDTDYSSYAAVYSCDDFLIEKAEIGIVLSRDPMVPESTVSVTLNFESQCQTDLPKSCLQIERALDAFRSRNISMTFERAEHSDSCAYEPSYSEYSCSREQFPDSVMGEVLSTLRLYKNTLIRALRAIIGVATPL